jgi:hypothetical protein
MDEDQRVWAAMIFPTGVTEVFGALRGSVRRYWMRLDAQQEVEHWITEMKLGPLRWQTIDDQIAIGCCDAHVFVVRSILLPRGDPPAWRGFLKPGRCLQELVASRQFAVFSAAAEFH